MEAHFTCRCGAPMETEGELLATESNLFIECTECEYSYVATLSLVGKPTGEPLHRE